MTRRDGLPGFSARSVRRGDAGTSEAVRDAVRKPWQAAVPVPHSACRRASKSLDDAPHHLRLFSYPTDRMGDPYGSFSSVLGIGDKKP